MLRVGVSLARTSVSRHGRMFASAQTSSGVFTVREGDRVGVWRRNGKYQQHDGPARIWGYRVSIQQLKKFVADERQYLCVRHRSGITERRPGPASMWFDPVLHEDIEVMRGTSIDAGEMLVVYREDAILKSEKAGTSEGDARTVGRQLLSGPAFYVPSSHEWVHQFSWHGAVNDKVGKAPNALRFHKLRTTPDSMYHAVNVRTKDDARLKLEIMIFYHLTNVKRMLDHTHDPICEMINTVEADIVDFVGRHRFESFKEAIDGLNKLENYPQLVSRAASIGYNISKVTLRSYQPDDPKLLEMHSAAIQERTRLLLETERQKQVESSELFKLNKQAERTQIQEEMERRAQSHSEHLKQMRRVEALKQEQHDLTLLEEGHTKRLAMQSLTRAQRLKFDADRKALQAAFYERLRSSGVDLSRWFVARAQRLPSKVERMTLVHARRSGYSDESKAQEQTFGEAPQLHLHQDA